MGKKKPLFNILLHLKKIQNKNIHLYNILLYLKKFENKNIKK